ncbi:bifunctional adenosylcobinamide kinase/adenosylcobinamide-phosphate guanylyltransferase [Spiractinospora alimapuensis]|uniref:bifunctional adenosylcobinamide kinase/adenosylcobinamide-phosphate guanylyltransferase n=1 Tax=Spiractinospora alimapuensis TaxID=2820884 RepID=UPI003743CFE5
MLVDDAFTLPAPGEAAPDVPSGFDLIDTAQGTVLRSADGGTLLYARTDPDPEVGAESVDLVLVDVVAAPSAVGALRRCGAVAPSTAIVGLGGDHRVRSPAELERWCRLWGVLFPSDNQVLPCPPKAWPPSRPHGPHRLLVLGGARSGKSTEAELRVLAEPEVTYVATGPAADTDAEWGRRVAAHVDRRPDWWRTVETQDAASVLRTARGAVLLDCVGTWLTAAMDRCGLWEESPSAEAEELLQREVDDLVAAYRETSAYVVAVSNEVGAGVVPATPSGRLFRDWLGRVNQLLSAQSEEAVLTVAGRVVDLP